MRVFLGIPLPKDVQDKIAVWQNTYQDHFSPQGLRWMKKENLHITLFPPWEEVDVVQTIHKLQKSMFAVDDFSIVLQKILFMPKGKAKYLWATGEIPGQLLQLREAIAVSLGKPIEQRPFRLHTTIARLNKDAVFTPIEDVMTWQFSIQSFALLQSQLLSKGAEYKILETFSLQ